MSALKVVVICPWFYRGDAVGAAAYQTWRDLADRPDLEVTGLWTVNDYPDIQGRQVNDVADLLLDRDFLAADVLIYVFAVYHPFFNALLVGNERAKQIVRFHNVTPKALMPEKHWPVIERSFIQIQNFIRADEIWADSPENLQELERQGRDANAFIEPLAVRFPAVSKLASKATEPVNLVYVGRFFESKGVLDVIQACALLRAAGRTGFRLSLIGNLRFSDPVYVEVLRAAISEYDLESVVDFVGSAMDEALAEAYRTAHIYVTGSRHEGFCVPVIEGLAAGCIPVSYALSNLRYVADKLGRLADEVSPEGLARALDPVIDALKTGAVLPLDRGPMTREAFDVAAADYVSRFTPQSFARRIGDRVIMLGRQVPPRPDPAP